ncbi:MAG: leucine-rich repeat protein [Ruminococcus sp.]|nr:leucine-rich repeat protein [Ruminococcus sp.]
MVKRLISILLVTVMLCTSVIIPVSAEETSTPKNGVTSVTDGNLAVTGTNSFGNLLSDKIQENTSQMNDCGSRISDIQVEGTTATVSYSAIEDCTILVGIFDETTDQLLFSGKTDVKKDEQSATVTIEADEMPKYFKIKAYMLNGINSPIAPEYNSPLYTKKIQELKEKTVNDFDESKVLNLDENEETNFAVYKDGTMIIEYQEGYNIPELIDSQNGKYVFSNASKEMLSLKSGDTFSCTYSESDVLVAVVDTIVISGTTVTITEGKTELEDVFEYVKIENDGLNPGDYSVDNSTISEGLTPITPKKSRAIEGSGAYSVAVSLSIAFNLGDKEYEGDKENIEIGAKIGGKVTFSATASLDVYLSGFDYYIKVGIEKRTDLSAQMEGNLDVSFDLPKINISTAAGVNIVLQPTLDVSYSASLSINVTMYDASGFSCSSDTGYQEESQSPCTESSFNFSGTVYIGISLEFGCNIICEEFAEASIKFSGGLEISGNFLTISDNKDDDCKHLCKACIEGAISKKFSVTGEISIFKLFIFDCTMFERSFKFLDWHFSLDSGHFAFTKCPYYQYKVSLTLTDNGKPLAKEKVYVNGAYKGKTNEKGMLTFYLDNGDYTLIANICTKDFFIGNAKKVLKVDTKDDSSYRSGKCGKDCYWQLDVNGVLTIYGSGEMDGYADDDLDERPWDWLSDSITSVVVCDGITKVGGRAFSYLENLALVSLGADVKVIGSYAFYNSKKLTKVSMYDSVVEISNYAFGQCSSLSKINTKETINSPLEQLKTEKIIGHSAFSGCSSLISYSIPSGTKIISSYAFNNCYKLQNVLIPNTVEKIGWEAFCGCSSIKTVRIPNSVTEIDSGAFRDCIGLNDIVIPSSVTRMGGTVFSGCEALTEIIIPNSIKVIEVGTFYNCKRLAKVVIPDTVTKIGMEAFYKCWNLENVILPENLNTLGDRAFYYCLCLKNITIPASVTNWGSGSFGNCTGIESVVVENGIKYIGEYAFTDCSGLTDVSIPNTVTNIKSGAFSYCESLEKITIPNSVKELGGSVFYRCKLLNNVKIPESVESIGCSAFGDCDSFTEITIPGSVFCINDSTFAGCDSLKSVTINAGVTGIEDGAFSSCYYLTSVSIPSSVNKIDNSAFYNCKRLEKIVIPEGVETMGNSIFEDCIALSSVSIPETVTSIGNYAFDGCSSLKSVVIPSKVEMLNMFMFRECYALENVTLPPNLTSIGDYAFACCESLKNITIPDTVTKIGHYVFDYCVALEKIEIPAGVSKIEQSTFEDCTNLKKVIINDGLTTIERSAFKNCTSLTEIIIPNSVTSIGDSAFQYCENLAKVTMPEYLKYLGSYAFYDCESLMSISIPYGITYISECTFSNCSSLTSVVIPNSVEYINNNAFGNCSSLENVSIPSSVKEIRYYAFSSCKSLTSITIPSSVTKIGDYAFAYCSSLETVVLENSATTIGYNTFSGCPCAEDFIKTENAVAINQPLVTSEEPTVSVTASEATNTASNTLTAMVSDLIKNTSYFVVVVKSDSVEDILSADNLLYFTQVKSDAEGKISLSYVPRVGCNAPVVLTYRAYVNNIEDADIVVTDMYYTGSEQTAEYVVNFNGKTLTESEDFTVSGDLSATETGCYELTFTGVNDYQGSVTVYFALVDPYLYGDTDMDGRITVKDSTTIQRYLAELEALNEDSYLLSDVDGNGEVNIVDVTVIQNYLAGVSMSSSRAGARSAVLK